MIQLRIGSNDRAWIEKKETEVAVHKIINEMLGIDDLILPYYQKPKDCQSWSDYKKGFEDGYTAAYLKGKSKQEAV